MSFNEIGALVVCAVMALAMLGIVVVPILYFGRNRRHRGF